MRRLSRILSAGLWCGLTSMGCGTPDKAAVSDGNVTTPYLEIGKGLANDSLDGLAEHAATVAKAAETKPEATGMASILQGAGRVAATDIATARAAFKTMSDGLIENLRKDPAQQKGLMLVHCTMAFKGKGGLWVQPQGKVANPYEGSAMPTCGNKVGWDDPLPES